LLIRIHLLLSLDSKVKMSQIQTSHGTFDGLFSGHFTPQMEIEEYRGMMRTRTQNEMKAWTKQYPNHSHMRQPILTCNYDPHRRFAGFALRGRWIAF
jgi:hypothetical protein